MDVDYQDQYFFGRLKESPISLISALGIIGHLNLFLERQSTLLLLTFGLLGACLLSYFLDRYVCVSLCVCTFVPDSR